MASINIGSGILPTSADFKYSAPVSVSVLGTFITDNIILDIKNVKVTKINLTKINRIINALNALGEKGGNLSNLNPAFETISDDKYLAINKRLRLDSCTILMRQNKNIVQTYVSGRNESIKEFIGMGDWEISVTARMTGFLSSLLPAAGDNVITNNLPISSASPFEDIFPADALDTLRIVAATNQKIPIVSKFINTMGVKNVIVKEVSCNPIQGSGNEFDLSMELIQDDDDIDFTNYEVK
jgi:hypothetical protein